MSLVSNNNISITLQSIKKLLSLKMSRDDLKKLIPNEYEVVAFVKELGLVDPITSENGALYTNEKGEIYTL